MQRTINKQKLSKEDHELIRITIEGKIYYCAPLPIERYFISTCGKVIAYKTHKKLNGITTFAKPIVLREYDNGTGYKKVRIFGSEGNKAEYVHRLVASTFFVQPAGLEQYEVNHLDFNKSNNSVANLELVTRSENLYHAKTLRHLKQAS